MASGTEGKDIDELVLACRTTDTQQRHMAMDELLAHLRPKVVRLSRRMVQSTLPIDHSSIHTGEDVAQEALVRFYKSFDQISDFDNVLSWFAAVIKRIVIDRGRAANARPSELLPDVMPDNAPSHLGVPGANIEIAEMLLALSDDHRDVVICTYWYGLTTAETARYLDIPLGTVRSRLWYAHRYLREMLDIAFHM